MSTAGVPIGIHRTEEERGDSVNDLGTRVFVCILCILGAFSNCDADL